MTFLLAACGGGEPAARRSEGPPETSVFFLEGEDTIEVRAFARLPLETAELVAPDGSVQTALDRQNEAIGDSYVGRPSFGIGGWGGSSSGANLGVGMSFPVLGGGSSATWYRSRASFPVLDMRHYRASWQDWRVRLRFRGAGALPTQLELPAPAPPVPTSPQSR